MLNRVMANLHVYISTTASQKNEVLRRLSLPMVAQSTFLLEPRALVQDLPTFAGRTLTCIYMLGTKYEFARSMDCAAQTMDPYFAQAIHGLRVQVYTSQFFGLFVIWKKKINPYTCMVCLNQLAR